MKRQVSGNEYDLSWGYNVLPVMIIGVGVAMIFLGFTLDYVWKWGLPYFVFSLGVLALGVILFLLVKRFVPYCYKIEVDDKNFYITKTEYVLTAPIENTIAVDKKLLIDVGESFLGVTVSFSKQSVFYLNFSVETEYGSRIAYLCEPKSVFTFATLKDELKKL